MSTAALRLEALHFPIQEVRANPLFNPQGDEHNSASSIEVVQHKIEGREDAIGIEVTLSSDNESSASNPYSFRIQGFCIMSAGEPIEPSSNPAIAGTAIHMIIGAIREHLAAMTARGPWGTHLISPIFIGAEKSKTDPTDSP